MHNLVFNRTIFSYLILSPTFALYEQMYKVDPLIQRELHLKDNQTFFFFNDILLNQ